MNIIKCNILVMYSKQSSQVTIFIIEDSTDGFLHYKNEKISLITKEKTLDNSLISIENVKSVKKDYIDSLLSDTYYVLDSDIQKSILLINEIQSYINTIDSTTLPNSAKVAAKLAAIKTIPLAKLIYLD